MNYVKLTPQQENIWNLQKFYEDTAISNICGAIIYREERNENALKRAINEVIKAQDGLRLVFPEEAALVQKVKEYETVTIETIVERPPQIIPL